MVNVNVRFQLKGVIPAHTYHLCIDLLKIGSMFRSQRHFSRGDKCELLFVIGN